MYVVIGRVSVCNIFISWYALEAKNGALDAINKDKKVWGFVFRIVLLGIQMFLLQQPFLYFNLQQVQPSSKRDDLR